MVFHFNISNISDVNLRPPCLLFHKTVLPCPSEGAGGGGLNGEW